MSVEAKVIEDSIGPNGKRLVTLQLRYPRFIHAEVMTHRVFSRNASSSRAIPVKKVLQQVWNDPATPIHWGANQSGMQAKTELIGFKRKLAEKLWKYSGRAACMFAWGMMKIGMHKQVANRILEPWQYIHVVLTATEFDNFFSLRLHEDAQPEIYALAAEMAKVMATSTPKSLGFGEWHLPYIKPQERKDYATPFLRRMSAARCARVSYLTHDGKEPDVEKDLALYHRLVGSQPIHASPTEHQAMPQFGDADARYCGNFVGWVQSRKLIEAEL